jgi:hypothetical protein
VDDTTHISPDQEAAVRAIVQAEVDQAVDQLLAIIAFDPMRRDPRADVAADILGRRGRAAEVIAEAERATARDGRTSPALDRLRARARGTAAPALVVR